MIVLQSPLIYGESRIHLMKLSQGIKDTSICTFKEQ